MGEFHDAVNSLLEAFSRGLTVLKCKRKQTSPQSTSVKGLEARLGNSLKKSRSDVRKAYKEDLARIGPGFAHGDGRFTSQYLKGISDISTAEAHSSLAAILFRLNAGFVSVIERFTKGHSTKTDYAALLNLSNASRMEAIYTFDRLSKRLSHSTLTLVPASPKQPSKTSQAHKKRSKAASTRSKKPTRSKSAPALLVTPEGLVRRPKHSRSSSASSSAYSPTSKPSSRAPPHVTKHRLPMPPPPAEKAAAQILSHHPTNRRSIMSIASDSTKLGEIPSHKWIRPYNLENGEMAVFPIQTYYPLEPYREPEKQKSRLRRLFRL
ncbi:hypothetical protein B0O99DRAFT_139426 [Bisporella sp. PMI_857]|nr:hypothetical protein B0O99DRAFT_139426 [Bisporella sp. PMI_857]